MRRLLTAAGLCLFGGLPAADGPLPPLDPLPPIERPLALDPQQGEASRQAEREAALKPVDRAGLAGDLAAMVHARERLRSLLAAGRVEGIAPGTAPATTPTRTAAAGGETRRELVEEVPSKRLGDHKLAIRRWNDGTVTVSAQINGARAEVAYRELLDLLGRSVDDQLAGSERRFVHLQVADAPWGEALDRLLGQVNLAWRELEGGRIVIFDLSRETLRPDELRRDAERALLAAARDLDDPASAEALCRLAEQEHRLARTHHDGRRYDMAVERYLEVIQRYDRNDARHLIARPWVRRAMRGFADAQAECRQFREARGVYLHYISSADPDDADLPEVFFRAAEASRELAAEAKRQGRPDPHALDRATELLQNLLTRFASRPDAQAVVVRSRLALGRLLFEREDYRGAKTYLAEHLRLGSDGGDQVRFLLAECSFHHARALRAEGLHVEADVHLQEATLLYERLAERARQGALDPLADPGAYRRAAFRIGECHLALSTPDYVRALFSFLQAQQRHREEEIPAEVLVHIARCYSELQAHDALVAQLQKLLAGDRLGGEARLDQLLGDIKGGLDLYPDTVRSKVLFYIAQANASAADRDPVRRTSRLQAALHDYQRVIDSNASPALRRSARLGLGRAALAAGDAGRGIEALREVIRNGLRENAPRDVALAAQLLGDHHRAAGELEQAIRAYQARIDDVRE